MHDFRLVRSLRRSLSISIQSDGSVLVRSPYGLSRSYIERFVESKHAWIDKSLEKWKIAKANSTHKDIGIGSSCKLEGQDYPLVAAPVARAAFDGQHLLLPLRFQAESQALPPSELSCRIREELSGLYRQRARQVLPAMTAEIAAQHHLRYSGPSITQARTRWGSCNARNHLNFSWRLMMADPECIRYVVCHELAHTVHHNHSEQFWQLVGQLYPDYLSARQRLRQLGKELVATGW